MFYENVRNYSLAGNMDFLHNDSQIALTKDMAMKLFGSVDVLGKELTVADNTVTVEAILEGLQHSNLAFGCWGRGAYFHQWQDYWNYASFQICAKLKKVSQPKIFKESLMPANIREIHETLINYLKVSD